MKLLANRVAWLTNASGANNITINDPVDEGGYVTPTDRFSYGDRLRFLVQDGNEWARFEGELTDGGAGSDWITRDKFLESSTGSDLDLTNTNGKLCYVEAGAEMLAADRGRLNIATTTGTGTAYLLDLPIPLEQLKDGVEVWFFVHTANTDPGAGVYHTLKVNATDPKPIKAGMPRRRLAFGAMAANALVGVKYSEAGACWVPIAGLVKTVKVVAASPYAFVEEDHQQTLVFNSAAAIAASIAQATGQFAAPFEVDFIIGGAGTTTITPTTSTINGAANLAVPTGQAGRLFVDGGNYRCTAATVASSSGVAPASLVGLTGKNNATTPNSLFDMACAKLLLDDASGNSRVVVLNAIVDIAQSGISGLDTGAEANSTHYDIWAVDRTTPTVAAAVTADASTDKITLNGHGLPANTPVILGGTAAPAGLTLGTTYYVKSPAANDFQLSATPGGAAINFTTAGTAVTVSTAPGLILTVENAAPTMPAGWTFKQLVGKLYNTSGGNFRKTAINGRRISIEPVQVLDNAAPGVANTWQSLSISTAVPAGAKTVGGVIGSGSSADVAAVIAVAGDANGVGMQVNIGYNYTTTMEGFYRGNGFSDVPLMTAQTVYWKGGTTGAFHRMLVTGFTF